MSDLTSVQLRKLLHENEQHLEADEKEIASMEAEGVPESIVNEARCRLEANRHINVKLKDLIAEIQ